MRTVPIGGGAVERHLNHLLEQFSTQGFLILKDFIEPSEIEEVRRGVGKIVDAHSEMLLSQNKVTEIYNHEPFEKRLYRLYENNLHEAPVLFSSEQHQEEFFGFFFHPRLLDLAEEILGGEVLFTQIIGFAPSSRILKRREFYGIKMPVIPKQRRCSKSANGECMDSAYPG